MKKLSVLVLLFLAACAPQATEKIFVANEQDGSVSVIDAATLKELSRVSLAEQHDGRWIWYETHNVQVVDDLVLVTANVRHDEEAEHTMSSGEHEMAGASFVFPTGIRFVEAHEEEEAAGHPDQLIMLDAKSHRILKRFDLGIDAHLAHVVSDGTFAYVTATDADKVYKVDLADGTTFSYPLPKGSMPHGLRLTPDIKTAVIAGMNNALLLLDLDTGKVATVPLPGKGVQAAVVGNTAFASVYETKQVAAYDLDTQTLSLIDLPPEAKGPIQLYPTPDGQFLYVADQGAYFDQPAGKNTYKIDLAGKKVIAAIDTGNAPHGVVVSQDNRVWITNLNGNSVSVIENDAKIQEIPVGKAPNGITFWSAQQ
jgi:YVTN family beta-propeller protein